MGLSVLIIGGCATLLQYRQLSSLPLGGDASILADVSVFSAEPSLPIVPSDIEILLRLEAHGPASLRNGVYMQPTQVLSDTPPQH